VVTASSSSLGKASATALAREGANVVINGRDERRLEAARAEISEVADGEVVTQQGDLTEKEDIETLVETTVSEFGGLDHLVTSAGGPPSGPFLETTDETGTAPSTCSS
jgi:3-oxoacyl-[acyl-carrier protein] reductase